MIAKTFVLGNHDLPKGGFMYFFLQIFAGAISNLCSISLIYLTAKLADDAISGEAALFQRKLPAMAGLLVLQLLFRFLQDCLCTEYKAQIGFRLRNQIYERRLQAADAGSSKAELLNLYNEGIDQMKEYAFQKAEVAISFFTMVCAAAVMAWIHSRLFVTSILLIPLFTYIAQRINRRFREKAAIIVDDKEQINHSIKEILEGFYIIKAYLLEEAFLRHFHGSCETLKKHEKEMDGLNTIAGRVEILLRYLPQLIIPLYGGWLCFQGQLQIGGLLAVNLLIGYVVLPMEAFIRFFKLAKTIQPIRDKINAYREAPVCANKEKNGADSLLAPALSVEGLSLSFEKHVIFQDFQMQVLKGEHLALMGESGCGKSTLLKIFCGLFCQYSGNVQIAGMPLNEGVFPSLRNKISYVPQEPYVFKGSIKENICMGSQISESFFVQLLDLTGLSEEVGQFPAGCHTLLGEGGVWLSGGQVKRLAIARALAANGEVFLMDEPMSALDPAKSMEIQEKLSDFLKGKTVILVTHQSLPYWSNMKTITLKRGGYGCEVEY